MRFSAHLKSKIIQAVNRKPYCYAGRFHGLDFTLYRNFGQIVLLVRIGKQWKQMTEPTVWDALTIVEQERKHGSFSTTDAAEARNSPAAA